MAFRSENRIPKRRPGQKLADSLTAAALNAPAEELAQIEQHIGRNLGAEVLDWPIVDHFLGKVYNSSAQPLYPASPRYEIKRSQPTWTLKAKDLLTVEDDLREERQNRIVIATNLAEAATTHLVQVDTVVHVFGVVVQKFTPVVHYYFFHGSSGITPVQLTGSGSNGSKTTAANYTYTVKTIDGNTTIATGVSPFYTRQFGKLTGAATRGHIWYEGSTIKLYPYEFPSTGACV
ncbi:MAG TPA: hypothetical protein VD994_07505 [Prosthecobacter sp.]|nr:hypothetical protein [Prosthecobacter sp.]